MAEENKLEPTSIKQDLHRCCYLSAYECILITGEDRLEWLNGMLTCDVRAVASAQEPKALYGCALNVKGKIISDAIVFSQRDSLAVYVAPISLNELIEFWSRYIIMEDVELIPEPQRKLVMLQGHDVNPLQGYAWPHAFFNDLGYENGLAYEVPMADVQQCLDVCVLSGAHLLDSTQVLMLRTQYARPTFGVDFTSSNYVQEAGIEARSVSFSKGCYLGQEVVCMLQMRGKVNKRLVQLELENTGLKEEISHGTHVYNSDHVSIGQITSIASTPTHLVALAMVKASASNIGTTLHVLEAKASIVSLAH